MLYLGLIVTSLELAHFVHSLYLHAYGVGGAPPAWHYRVAGVVRPVRQRVSRSAACAFVRVQRGRCTISRRRSLVLPSLPQAFERGGKCTATQPPLLRSTLLQDFPLYDQNTSTLTVYFPAGHCITKQPHLLRSALLQAFRICYVSQ